jgi:hypothetical protein
VTWRVGQDWRPVFDDEQASVIRVDFTAAAPGMTDVVLTYAQLYRHGEFAAVLREALAGPDPGQTLVQYASVVPRHAAGLREA